MSDPVLYQLPAERMPNGEMTKPVFVHFEEAFRENTALSKAAGHPIHDRLINAIIVTTGKPTQQHCQTVVIQSPDGTRKFDKNTLERLTKGLGEATEKFLAGEAPAILGGTPITEWAGVDRRTATDLKAANILTVEQLAEAGESALQYIWGGRELQDKAKKHVRALKDDITNEKLAAENAALKARLEALEKAISDPEKRKPGRPRKEAA